MEHDSEALSTVYFSNNCRNCEVYFQTEEGQGVLG